MKISDRKAAVLVVDDRPEKLLALQTLLAEMPLEIVLAASGREALRHLLQRDFAVILLDVNMPIMDGFETAALIRQRKSSEHIPIIFITAYGDEVFVERGYSLGAVDYILQPVIPEVLRAKVAVFVELFHKTEELRHQVDWHYRHAMQLQRFAQASILISSATSMHRILELTTQTARDLIAAEHAAIWVMAGAEGNLSTAVASSPDPNARRFAEFATTEAGHNAVQTVLKHHQSVRLEAQQVAGIPAIQEWRQNFVPRGLMAAQLASGRGLPLGALEVFGKTLGDFTAEDEAILVLLAQMASIAIENAISIEARDANRAKDQFLAALSHELRTPLTPVLATLCEIGSDTRIPSDIRDDLQMIRRNVELEARLIDDLLDLTRISKGKIEIRADAVDTHALFAEALNVCHAEITEKSLRVTTDLVASHFHVNADLARLQQVFWNLIKNAVKFTPPGGSIHIASDNPDEGSLRLRFTDTGIGIAPEFLARIFDAFEQGEPSITRQFGGLGLGLAITKALIDAHHGTISAASEGRNKGATFTITLPLAPATLKATPFALPRLVKAAPTRSLKILLVEDHADTARVMSRLLVKQSHEVQTAHSVAQALQIAEHNHFDLLISDIGLPDGSGLELMREFLKRRPIAGIALSGFGMEEDIRRSKEAGFFEHLTKPVDFQRLADCIDRICLVLDETTSTANLAG